MTKEEQIAANAANGYFLVAEFDGWSIYKKKDEVGGWTYYSDAIGNEGAYVIWSTSVRSNEELLTLVHDMSDSIISQMIRKPDQWQFFVKFCTAVVAADNARQPVQQQEPTIIECPKCKNLQTHSFSMSGKLHCNNCGNLLDQLVEYDQE